MGKKILTLLLILAIFLSFSAVANSDDSEFETRLDIEIRCECCESLITTANVGDIIRVTVSMTGFENLSDIYPSLHFNQSVVQVVYPLTRERISESRQSAWHANNPNLRLFTTGNAIGGVASEFRWAGTVRMDGIYPFVDNGTGFIGMWFATGIPWTLPQSSLNGTQEIYSIYFEIIGAGNADIRLPQVPDEPYWRIAIGYFQGRINHAMYNIERLDPFNPANSIFDSFVDFKQPEFRVAGPELVTRSGRQVGRLSDIQGEPVFARIDREFSNISESARLILAVFEDGEFYTLRISGGDRTEGYAELPVGNVTVKVLVWNDIQTMTPIFEPLII